MESHINIAGRLLRDAAIFFRNIGEENPPLKDQMEASATVYEQVADLLESDPHGQIPLDIPPASGAGDQDAGATDRVRATFNKTSEGDQR
ncbi:MAG: hypothetical protein H7A21_06150 [Spirochaetales bacterium]|nr:hypothetical protein [Leptospiraceae bacterium]MCP5480993.1 hypothetical protein [Spirochaetales bacterium]MCP5485373.1 hypothetical protein [Spirochaetales bacterium]